MSRTAVESKERAAEETSQRLDLLGCPVVLDENKKPSEFSEGFLFQVHGLVELAG